MLLGEYEHSIDDKNRLTLPAKLRDSFADGLVLTRGIERCLYVYPRAQWEHLVESRLAPLDPLSSEARRIARYFYSGAAEGELDRQGRVMIPGPLAAHADLSRDVVIAGAGDRVEVWNRDGWRKQLQEIEGSAEDVAESLARRND